MKLEFRTSWFRVLIEILRPPAPIRRHRVVPAGLDGATHRLLRRSISRHLRPGSMEAQT